MPFPFLFLPIPHTAGPVPIDSENNSASSVHFFLVTLWRRGVIIPGCSHGILKRSLEGCLLAEWKLEECLCCFVAPFPLDCERFAFRAIAKIRKFDYLLLVR